MSQSYRVIAFYILIFFAVYNLNNTYAVTVDQLKQSIDSKNQEIKALDLEIQEYNKKISSTKGEAKTLQSELKKLTEAKNNLNREIDQINLQIENTNNRIQLLDINIKDKEAKINYNKRYLASIFNSLNQKKDNNRLESYLFNDNISNSLQNIDETFQVNDALYDHINEVKVIKVKIEEEKSKKELEKENLNKYNEALADKKLATEITEQNKNSLLQETKNKESEYQKQLSEKKRLKNALEAEVSDYESKLKAVIDASKLPSTGNGVLAYPVKNVKITQYFGNTPFASQNPQVYNGSGHNGIDFGVPIGTAIYSAAQGTVIGTGDSDKACAGASYGKWVLIRHNNGLTTLYAHLSSILVSSGQAVDKGDRIALSGNTGYSTGPHLHFTVYASEGVRIPALGEYKSKACGTNMIIPLAPRNAYLNPLSYF